MLFAGAEMKTPNQANGANRALAENFSELATDPARGLSLAR